MNSQEAVALVAIAVLALALKSVWVPGWRVKRKPQLQYEVLPIEASSLARQFRTMGDVACKLYWGSPSSTTWERACQASLEASRQRRERGR